MINNVKDNDMFKFMFAGCHYNYYNIVELGLKNGADVNMKDKRNGYSLIRYACEFYDGDDNIIQLLLNYGADMDERVCVYKYTCLHVACWTNEIKVIKLLLDKGANINIRDVDGNTPIISACGYGSIDIAKLLLEHGANINDKNNEGYTPLIYSHQYCVTERKNNIINFLKKEINKRVYILSLIVKKHILEHHIIKKID